MEVKFKEEEKEGKNELSDLIHLPSSGDLTV